MSTLKCPTLEDLELISWEEAEALFPGAVRFPVPTPLVGVDSLGRLVVMSAYGSWYWDPIEGWVGFLGDM